MTTPIRHSTFDIPRPLRSGRVPAYHIVVRELASIFDSAAGFDLAGDFEAFLKSVPARWVVYALADEQGRPIQLLCVKNLRASLKKRLASDAPQEPTRRVDYQQIVRQVFWTRVDSAFEADIVYLAAARELFPETYQGMVGFRPAWFVHVDPKAPFPRYVKTTDLSARAGMLVGPIEDKHAAARLIELIEDAFDLCRYYNVLVEAPHGRACAYKEMGRCPAPCDGSIEMGTYRETIAQSLAALINPERARQKMAERMGALAAELQFEQAGRVKAMSDRLSQLGKGPFRHARPMSEFRFLSFQHGPRAGTVKLFLITPGQARCVACLTGQAAPEADLLRNVLALSADAEEAVDPAGAERVGVVSHHLFVARQKQGVFLPVAELNEKSLAKALRDLQKQTLAEESEGEGVTRELNAL